MASRRLIAVATALSIAWTALWPLVSSAQALAAGESMPLCHQAGMQVAPDMAPMDDSQQPSPHSPAKQHCPLCVMAFLAAFTPPVVAPTPPQLADGDPAAAYWAPSPGRIAVRLPQGRAPPVSLRS